ncbi:hypothetical protein QG041_00835 [Kingella kingae]|uniref:hypothetical protein n=1 Tax=Kingella kingae TaxID=504 RepID=UPI0002585032|nr:hypothetical protein [Kingella kingae]EIC13940.1 hypothetical protein KKB_02935 [Kingella kingae PYKK081]MDK4567851.1 hypothetical protein [Kingella kingae]MDK4569836.1 hypothetical protein [Kingella kingae]MDK4571771.1 hypothetical protein [Kingella kingae]MDK4597818.1 hypothetical protein [Kingella kingae]
MKQEFKLKFGLQYNGAIHFQAALKPLSIGAELAAMADEEDLPALPENATNAQIAHRNVQKNLIYWVKQLEVDGIPADVLTVDYLLDHLSGEDYAQLFDEQEQLRAKSTAATVNHEIVAAKNRQETTKTATETSTKLSS